MPSIRRHLIGYAIIGYALVGYPMDRWVGKPLSLHSIGSVVDLNGKKTINTSSHAFRPPRPLPGAAARRRRADGGPRFFTLARL